MTPRTNKRGRYRFLI